MPLGREPALKEKTTPCVQIQHFKYIIMTHSDGADSVCFTERNMSLQKSNENCFIFCLLLHVFFFYCIYVILQSGSTHHWHVIWFQAHDDKTFMSHILLAGVTGRLLTNSLQKYCALESNFGVFWVVLRLNVEWCQKLFFFHIWQNASHCWRF